MKICVQNIKCDLKTDILYAVDKAVKVAGLKRENVTAWRIIKKSVDARDKKDIHFVYSVMLNVDDTIRIRKDKNIKVFEDKTTEKISIGSIRLTSRPVIVGSGPSGLFAGLLLAEYGYCPIIVEMGGPVETRIKKVRNYWETGLLDPHNNVQFGEGGAGTFSDGKLTTGISDPLCDYVLEMFVKYGAPDEITYSAKPHIGTDILRDVVVNMRRDIVSKGGDVLFNTQMRDIILNGNKICGVTLNDVRMDCDVLILALGHSSRSSFEMLLDKGINIVTKPISIGVRIEHLQETINYAQYGEYADLAGPADYKLATRFKDRAVYSFCMCPGGVVVASASEPESIVTNGMSYYSRNEKNANAALVVSVDEKDYPSKHPLAGIQYQRIWERAAFCVGNGKAPVQTVGDFFKDKKTESFGSVCPSYTGKIELCVLKDCLPDIVIKTLKDGITGFDTKIKGFAGKDAVLTGVETRTSSPVRILRDENRECIGFTGIYPAGEGAGYAGGIMSAAVDGLRVAQNIIRKYSPKD